MWLAAIGKRTPGAYFVYFTISSLLVLLPVAHLVPSAGELIPFHPSKINFLWLPVVLLCFTVVCHRIFVLSDLFQRNTLWPGHAFLLIAILAEVVVSVPVALVHGTAGIVIVNEMANTQYNMDARKRIFNIGLVLGVAGLTATSAVLLIPFVVLGMRTLRPLQFREYVVFILGFGLPLYFYWAFFFLTGRQFPQLVQGEWFEFSTGLSVFRYAAWCVALMAVALVTSYIAMGLNSFTVRMRRLFISMIYLSIGGFLMAAADGLKGAAIFYIAPGFAFLATLYVLIFPNKRRLEVFHLIFVLVIIGVVLMENTL